MTTQFDIERWGVRLAEPVDAEMGAWLAELPVDLVRELENSGSVERRSLEGWTLTVELP